MNLSLPFFKPSATGTEQSEQKGLKILNFLHRRPLETTQTAQLPEPVMEALALVRQQCKGIEADIINSKDSKVISLNFTNCDFTQILQNIENIETLNIKAQANGIAIRKSPWNETVDQAICSFKDLYSKGFTFDLQNKLIALSIPSSEVERRGGFRFTEFYSDLRALTQACSFFHTELVPNKVPEEIIRDINLLGLNRLIFTRSLS